jgi:hypothetical protein
MASHGWSLRRDQETRGTPGRLIEIRHSRAAPPDSGGVASFAGMYVLVPPQTVAGNLGSVGREQWAPALPTEERRGDRLVFVDGRAVNDEPGWKTRW